MLAAVRSDVGKIRKINEDFTFLSNLYNNGKLLAILADGMGGHLAGEVASKIAVETILSEIDPLVSSNFSIEQMGERLKEAIITANSKVYEYSIENDGCKGMGTTVVTAIISQEGVLLAHIGDSRAYIIDQKRIKQLTNDHSLVNELLRNGQITIEEAIDHPQKNILTRALGTDKKVEIDLSYINWENKDTLVLCSDGLTNQITDQRIFTEVHNNHSVEELANGLLTLANEAGGDDNISIIVVRNEEG